MTLKEIADQLESCGYVCEAGKLEMNEAFIALRKYAQQEQSNEAADCATDVEEYEEMTIEAAIKHCEEVGRHSPFAPCEREHMQLAAWLTELVSLRAQHEQPNEPLTLEELREMDGEKIHIRCIGHCKNFYEDETAPYFGKNEQYIQHYNGMLRACDLPLQYYGEEWLAYRRKPEKEDDRND